MVSPKAIKALQKYLRRVSTSGSSQMLDSAVDSQSLKRLVRLLELRTKDAEFLGLDFHQDEEVRTPKRPRKSISNLSHKPKDHTGGPESASRDAEESSLVDVLNRAQVALDAYKLILDCFCVLVAEGKAGDELVEAGFSENLILTGVNLLKTQLSNSVLTILTLMSKEGDEVTSHVKATQALLESIKYKTTISLMICKIYDIMGSLCTFLNKDLLSEAIVIQVAFVALSSFFLDGSISADGVGLNKLQFRGIELCQSIFAQYPSHRTFMLDEIASNMIKLLGPKRAMRQYRLPDGKSIQMITALILQMLQGCFSNKNAASVAKETLEGLTVEASRGFSDINADAPVPAGKKSKAQRKREEELLQEAEERLHAEEILIAKFSKMCRRQLEVASQCAHYFLKFLLGRSVQSTSDIGKEKGKGKRAGSSNNEAEYKAALENLLKDLITVYNAPEWPGAELLLAILSRILVQTLDDVKKPGDTGLRAISIEWLGTENLPQGEIGEQTSASSMTAMWTIQSWISDWLLRAKNDDRALQSAQCSFAYTWGSSMSPVAYATWPEAARSPFKSLVQSYCAILSQEATRPNFLAVPGPPFNENADGSAASILDMRPSVVACIEIISERQSLSQSFDKYLQRIGSALDSYVITLRAKALKAMQEIFAADPTVLRFGNVRQIIHARMMDQSTSVRDAAIELIGKFLVAGGSELLVSEYYPMIAERILDVVSGDQYRAITIDIAAKLMVRLTDEEDTVKDLAFKALHDLWLLPFADSTLVPADTETLQRDQAWSALPATTRDAIRHRAMIMVSAVADSKAAQDSFGVLLERSFQQAGKSDKVELMAVCRSLVECLLEEILCLEEQDSKAMVMNVLVLILQFSKVFPALLCPHIRTLHTYLGHSGVSIELKKDVGIEQRTKFHVIAILRNVVLVLRDPNMDVLSAIEADLAQSLTQGSQQLVAVAVPCLTAIISHVTFHYEMLTTLLKKCFDFSERTRKAVSAGSNKDKLGETPKQQLSAISSDSIVTACCDILLFFVDPQMPDATKSMSLSALGNLFIAYPRLMLRNDSSALIDSVFRGPATLKITLIKTFVEYLHGEQARDAEKKKAIKTESSDIDIQVLIGNADEMGDAGISSSIMQTYLPQILETILSPSNQLTLAAFDLVELIIEQGLVHPLLCMPAIVSMEGSRSPGHRDRAARMHAQLNEKHASFINSKNIECVKAMFQYTSALARQQADAEGKPALPVLGYLPPQEMKESSTHIVAHEPLLGVMLSLVQSKRSKRNEFLGNLVKLMDVDTSKEISTTQLNLCRFVAENLALFEYKTQEEVLHVIYHCYRILSVTGEGIVREIERRDDPENAAPLIALTVLAPSSICMSLLLVLKTYLQAAYSLSSTRVTGFKPNEGARSTEKGASKNSSVPSIIGWERIPFAMEPPADDEARILQCQQYRKLMHDDYVSGTDHDEPELESPAEDVGEDANHPNPDSAFPDVVDVDTVDESSVPPPPRAAAPKPPKRRPSTAAKKRKQSTTGSSAHQTSEPPAPDRKKRKKSVVARAVASGSEDNDDSSDLDWR
ncbi:Sister chromatid cohesion protein 2 [Thoreauomyces humboldtii]|nr:Sister chromatid cohesion protein 2 [Thoreauomyces humboldtii]